ncbi:MAG: hypothetical protein ACOH1R_06825 [Luteimonas sp.]
MGLHFSDTLVGKVFEHLGGLSPKGGEPDPLALGPGADLPGVDPLKPLDGPQGHSHRDGPDMGGPNMGGPSLPQRSGPPTGGPAPQGMQDVSPHIAQQIIGNAFSMTNAINTQIGEALLAPAPSVANARADAAPGQMQAQGQTPGTMASASTGAIAQAHVAISAAPTSAVPLASSPAATAATMANPSAPAWAQVASTAPRLVGDSAALAQNRIADGALPPRPENASLMSRLAAALHLAPTTPNTLAAVPTLPAGTTQAMAAAGVTVAVTSINAPVDARGAILPANDHAAIRADNTLGLAGHTLEGMQRRTARNRVQLLSPGLSRLLSAMGVIGLPSEQMESNTERDVQVALQWLFWMLAIIAYGCLAAALVVLVGGNGHLFDYQAGRRYTGWMACLGLFSGVAAWWLARRMMRRR